MAAGGGLLPPPASTGRPVNPPPAKQPQIEDWSDFFSAPTSTTTR